MRRAVDRPAGGAARRHRAQIVRDGGVRLGIDVLASALSGGNQRAALIVGREMSGRSKILKIASHPTRGVDNGCSGQRSGTTSRPPTGNRLT